jgi:hypothetical protein
MAFRTCQEETCIFSKIVEENLFRAVRANHVDSLCFIFPPTSTYGGVVFPKQDREEEPSRCAPNIYACDTKPNTFRYLFAYLDSLYLPFAVEPWYSLAVLHHFGFQERSTMEWTTPQHEEVDLNCEISSYANAEL